MLAQAPLLSVFQDQSLARRRGSVVTITVITSQMTVDRPIHAFLSAWSCGASMHLKEKACLKMFNVILSEAGGCWWLRAF